MNISGNTILVTGGNSGIGRGLAEAFLARGNRVIVTGRNRRTLDEAVAANPGISAYVLDVADAGAIKAFAAQVVAEHPDLNVALNNAGIMANEDLTADRIDLEVMEATIATNLLGPIRLTAALLPHLRSRPRATIITVSSGLAFVPVGRAPTYCATKAAIHSWSQSLRFQLRDTPVQVIELAPPLVATDLQPGQRDNPRALGLEAFIAEAVNLMETHPDAEEICVERVGMLRTAEREGRFAEVFAILNTTG